MNLEDDILIERFLNGQLSEEENTSFLERMKSDAEFKDQVTLEKQLSESLNDDSWSFLEDINDPEVKEYEALLRSKESQHLKQSIAEARVAFSKSHESKKKNWLAYAAAAVITILIVLNIFSNDEIDSQELYKNFLNKTDLLALVERSDYSNLSNAQGYFDNKNYKEAARILSQVVDSLNNANAYLYLAISQIELKKYTNAESTLEKLINSNLLDAEKGYWYKSLLYLKSDQTQKLKEELKTIISNSYYKKEEAKELLSKLK